MFIVMNNIVSFAKVLADSTRWRIIRLVMEDALCVCELADILEMPQSSVSSHVQVIRKGGLLESEKCEKWTYFRIKPEYRELIGSMETFFSDAGDTMHQSDANRSVRRLAVRENSCCPGPKSLKS